MALAVGALSGAREPPSPTEAVELMTVFLSIALIQPQFHGPPVPRNHYAGKQLQNVASASRSLRFPESILSAPLSQCLAKTSARPICWKERASWSDYPHCTLPSQASKPTSDKLETKVWRKQQH